LLEIPGLAVKFFLPAEQRSTLERAARTDRLDVQTLTWAYGKKEALREVLRRRIATFNRRGMQRLEELCAPELQPWIEGALLDEGGDSPRSLIRLGNELFKEHCRDLPMSGSEIQIGSWQQALERFRSIRRTELERDPLPSAPAVSVSLGTNQPVLRVEVLSGRVFRNEVELLPPLADQEFRLLAFLYQRRGHICSHMEIGQVVFSGQDGPLEAMNGVDEALRSLVYRLRKRIEPVSGGEHVFVKTVPGRGYRLDNAA
jgi:hypothetical protein